MKKVFFRVIKHLSHLEFVFYLSFISICLIGNYEEYINDICWVSNTYHVALDQKLPEADDSRKKFELKYYQWVF